MPTESRVLHFAKREILEALRDYRSQMGEKLPREDVQGLNLIQDSEIAVDLKTVGNGHSTTFTDAEVVSALIIL